MFPGIIYFFFLSQSEQNRNESAYTLLIVARQLSKGAAHSNSYDAATLLPICLGCGCEMSYKPLKFPTFLADWLLSLTKLKYMCTIEDKLQCGNTYDAATLLPIWFCARVYNSLHGTVQNVWVYWGDIFMRCRWLHFWRKLFEKPQET